MLRLLRTKPFSILVPGAVLLFGLILFVHGTEPSRHQGRMSRSDLADRIRASPGEGLERFTKPPLPADALIRKAEKFLIDLGYETESLVRFMWPNFGGLRLALMTAQLSDEEIAELGEKGAPLVKWSVTFYDPEQVIRDRRMVVSLDQHGRICDFRSYDHSPQPFPRNRFDDWLESSKLEIAEWLGVDPRHLTRREATNRMFDQHRFVGAIWSIDEPLPGNMDLAIGVRQREDSFHVYRTLSRPGAAGRSTPAFVMPKGFSFWATMLASALMAFGIGLARNESSPDQFQLGGQTVRVEGLLKLLLLVGIGLVIVVGLIQAAVLTSDEWYSRLMSFGFLGGAAVFTWFWISVRRHDSSRRPTNVNRGLRLLFLTAVPASYAVASFACLGWSFEGCCRACTLLRYGVAPLVFFAVLLGGRDRRFYAYALLLGGVTLAPHCICGNLINQPWIDWLSGSPMCYMPGFATGLVAISGLSGVVPRLCATVLIGLGAVVLAGSVGHTVFHFPW